MVAQLVTLVSQPPTLQPVPVVDQVEGGGGSAPSRSTSTVPHLILSAFSSSTPSPNTARVGNSPAMPQASYDNRASSIYPPTISPPDSPRTDDADSFSPNISPISTVAPSQPWTKPTSIPAPARQSGLAPPAESRSTWRNVVGAIGRSPSPGQSSSRQHSPKEGKSGEPTKWDGYSGERATNGDGKPAAASPTAHPYTGTGPGFGFSTEITGGSPKPSHFLGVKLKKASERPEPPRQQQQEPWRGPSGVKGASGRTATVDYVEDTSVAADKKHFPTPAERRARKLFQKPGSSGRASPGPGVGLGIRSATPTGRRTPQHDIQSKQGGLRVITGALDSVREAASNVMSQRDKSPDPPRPGTHVPDGPVGEVIVNQPLRYKYKLGDSSSREQSPMTPTYDRSGYPGLEHRSSEGMLRNQAFNQGNRSFTEPLSDSPAAYATGSNMYHVPPRKDSRPFSGTSSEGFDADRITAAFHHMGFNNQPKSHFSVTTYNTSIAGSSPPQTPQVPGYDDVPPLPTAEEKMSILNRKRPVPSASNQFRTKPPSRKPTPMQNDPNGNGPTSDPENKSDEPAKPVDRVQELEDKLKALNNRKISLAQMIHELTNVVHPSSVHYDMASREEIKKSVARMKTEQDTVLAEIQEMGIKLHRAHRKRDEAEGRGGGMWVRRVTE